MTTYAYVLIYFTVGLATSLCLSIYDAREKGYYTINDLGFSLLFILGWPICVYAVVAMTWESSDKIFIWKRKHANTDQPKSSEQPESSKFTFRSK
jgi:hypothetical protein